MSTSDVCAVSFRNLPRRRFTPEFKRRVVEHLLSSGRAVAEVARDHDLHPSLLGNWRRDYRRSTAQPPSGDSDTRWLPVHVDAPTFSCQARPEHDAVAESAPACLRVDLPKGSLTVYAQCPEHLLRLAVQVLR